MNERMLPDKPGAAGQILPQLSDTFPTNDDIEAVEGARDEALDGRPRR
jgi:hypothetical protein